MFRSLRLFGPLALLERLCRDAIEKGLDEHTLSTALAARLSIGYELRFRSIVDLKPLDVAGGE